jgi:hypothetical protein
MHPLQCSSSVETLLRYCPEPRLRTVCDMAVACLKHIYTQKLQRKIVNVMTSRQARLQNTYFWVLRILQDNPDLTQRELGEQLGISIDELTY